MPKSNNTVTLKLRRSISRGAFIGARTWTIFAIIESCFLSMIPWLLQPSHMYSPVHIGFIALQLTLFLLLGFGLGSLFGVIGHLMGLKNEKSQLFSLDQFSIGAVNFSVIVIFFWHFSQHSWWPSPTGLSVLAISTIIFTAWILQIWCPKWKILLAGITDAWTVALLLPGSVWIDFYLLPTMQKSLDSVIDVNSANIKLLVPTIYVVCILVIASFVSLYKHRRMKHGTIKNTPTASHKFGFVYAALGVLTFNLFVSQTVYTDQGYTENVHIPSGLPNILLITLDTTRADHLSIYGYERNTTPNLEKLAKNAVVFNRAIATGDMTLSTHASIFTGLYALQHGAHNDPPKFWAGRPLNEKFLTLTEILSAHKYLTLGVISNYGFLGHGFGIPQGFNYYDSKGPVVFLKSVPQEFLSSKIRELLLPYFESADYDVAYRNAETINSGVFEVLNRIDKKPQRPFFLFVN